MIGPVPFDGVPPVVRDGRARRAAVAGFVLGADALALLAPLLVIVADAVAVESGLTSTFVGTLLVGLTTSLPELAATVSAVRLGALDLAVGNVFGSVAFNLMLLAVLDASYRRGPLLEALAGDHLLTTLLLVICLALALMGILARTRRRQGRLRVESALILVVYAVGVWLLLSPAR